MSLAHNTAFGETHHAADNAALATTVISPHRTADKATIHATHGTTITPADKATNHATIDITADIRAISTLYVHPLCLDHLRWQVCLSIILLLTNPLYYPPPLPPTTHPYVWITSCAGRFISTIT